MLLLTNNRQNQHFMAQLRTVQLRSPAQQSPASIKVPRSTLLAWLLRVCEFWMPRTGEALTRQGSLSIERRGCGVNDPETNVRQSGKAELGGLPRQLGALC